MEFSSKTESGEILSTALHISRMRFAKRNERLLNKTVSRLKLVFLLLGILALVTSVQQARTEEPAVVRARVDIKPDVLHLRCPRNLIACYIELPQGYRPSSIDVSSIRLNRTLSPIRAFTVGDYDNDGVPDLQIMFERAPVIRYIVASVDITQIMEHSSVAVALTATGRLNDGTAFQGTDVIRVLIPLIRGAL
jgi:hypothetical protein